MSRRQFEVITNRIAQVACLLLVVEAYRSWFTTFRTPKQTFGSSRLFRLPPCAQVAGGVAIIPPFIYVGRRLWSPLPVVVPSQVRLFLRVMGVMLVVGGVGLWFWARRTLGPMMNVSTSSAVQLEQNPRLVTGGPYAYVRHPMYVSYGLLLSGLLLMYWTWPILIMLVSMAASMSRRARREDEALAQVFGVEWKRYAGRVPALLPRII